MSSFEGNLTETPFNEVLMRLRGEGRTGVLTLQSHEDIVAISVEEGRVVGADALNETLEEGLGGVLVAEGLVTEAQFEAAVTRVSGKEGQINEILISEGLISAEDYLAVLRRYTIGLVRRMQAWSEGEFRFFVGDDVAYEEGFEPIRMKELLPPGQAFQGSRHVVETAEVDTAASGLSEPDAPEPGEVASGPSAAPPPTADEAVAGSDPEDLPEGPAKGTPEREAEEGDVGESMPPWDEAPDWVARVAPILVLLLLLTTVVWRPNSLVYPFFWLETERLELEKQRRTSVYQKIDRAAKTFFLLESRFPDDLHSLVGRGLLAAEDVVGAGGRVLGYLPGDRGYVIRPGAADGTDPGVSRNEAIAGNFFLDPEFVIQPPDRGPAPLVLLD